MIFLSKTSNQKSAISKTQMKNIMKNKLEINWLNYKLFMKMLDILEKKLKNI